MAVPASRTGLWRSLRELPGRTPLRVKLISVVLALVAVALLVISVASVSILKRDLLGNVDSALQADVQPATQAVRHVLATGTPLTQAGAAVDWISGGQIQPIVTPTAGLGQGNFGGFGGSTMSGPAVRADSSWLAANNDNTITLPSHSGSARWRVLLVGTQFTTTSGGTISGTIAIAVDVTGTYSTIGELATIDLLVSLVIVALLAVIVIALIRRSLRPLTDIEQTAGAIAAGDLTQRVPERDPRTEVGSLGRSLNTMLSQIETAFEAQSQSEESARRSEQKMRQFVADASHELRTPLTAIRGFAEYYRQRGGVEMPGNGSGHLARADLDRIMRRVEQESARMGVLVEDMLLLARLDQQRPLEARTVDLLTLAADAVHDARVVAPDRSIQLTVGSPTALLVIGDEVRLRQVIGNLMNNALTHTPAGTAIDVLIRAGSLDEAPLAPGPEPPSPDFPPSPDIGPPADVWPSDVPPAAVPRSDVPPVDVPPVDVPPSGAAAMPVAPAAPGGPVAGSAGPRSLLRPAAVLEVRDYGPGLTREQAERVFERFYRGDPARTSGGTGLGLAIVAALVAAHGGATWVESRPGDGATFCIALPLSPEAAAADEYDDEEIDAGYLALRARHGAW